MFHDGGSTIPLENRERAACVAMFGNAQQTRRMFNDLIRKHRCETTWLKQNVMLELSYK
jgi:hypothetical protein